MPSVFIVGATGYIGGSVVAVLQQNYPTFDFVALARSPSAAASLSQTGVRVVIGTFDDHDTLTHLASEADIVINVADCDSIPLTEDLLRGIKKRWEASGNVGTLIHTSGSGIFLDGSNEGRVVKDGKVWTDSEEDIKLLTTSMVHGQVDVPILKAGNEGFVNTYIICPSAVYGPPLGVGGERRVPIFIKFIVSGILQHKKAEVVNEGSNVFGMIHINDLMAVYTSVFALALQSLNKPAETSSFSRYFIANTYDASWKTIMTVAASDLQRRGLIANVELVSVPVDTTNPSASFFASNSVCTAQRARDMFGWERKERKFEDGDVAADVDTALAALA